MSKPTRAAGGVVQVFHFLQVDGRYGLNQHLCDPHAALDGALP